METRALQPPNDAAVELHKPGRAPSTAVIEQTYGLTDAEYSVLLRTTCKDAPREMAAFFMVFCRRRNLDPFAKHVYLWKQKEGGEDKWQIVSGIDGLRVIASRNPLYRGQSKPVWELALDDNGKPILFGKEESKFGNIAGKRRPVSCEVIAYRGIPGAPYDVAPMSFYGIARFDEFVKTRDGKIHGNWENQPEHQLSVRAEALALRKAFPEDVGGIYLEDELRDRERVEAAAPTNGKTRTESVRAMLDDEDETEAAAPAQTPEPVEDAHFVEAKALPNVSKMTDEELEELIVDEAREHNVSPHRLSIIKNAFTTGGVVTKKNVLKLVEEIRKPVAPAVEPGLPLEGAGE